VPDLVGAPELAAIILLDHALDVTASALVAEHMTLIDDFHRPRDQGPVLSLAYTICLRASGLRDTLVRYRRAVRDVASAADNVPNDDLPSDRRPGSPPLDPGPAPQHQSTARTGAASAIAPLDESAVRRRAPLRVAAPGARKTYS